MATKGAELAQAVKDRMNVDQAAEYLGLAASTLNKWRIQGKGPRYVRIGNRVRYRRPDLDAYTEASVVETADSRDAA